MDLEPSVASPDEVVKASIVVCDEIAGLEDRTIGAVGIEDEPLRGHFRIIPVAVCNVSALDDELTGFAWSDVDAVFVDDAYADAGKRTPHRDERTGEMSIVTDADVQHESRLGRVVAPVERGVFRKPLPPRFYVSHRTDVGAKAKSPYTREIHFGRKHPHEPAEEGGCERERRDPFPFDQLCESVERFRSGIECVEGGSVEERSENLSGSPGIAGSGGVAQALAHRPTRSGSRTDDPLHVAFLARRDAFGRSGRSGCEDELEQLVRLNVRRFSALRDRVANRDRRDPPRDLTDRSVHEAELRVRAFENSGDPVARIACVYREVVTSSLEYGKHGRNDGALVAHHDRHREIC